jgi:hypothetical protein
MNDYPVENTLSYIVPIKLSFTSCFTKIDCVHDAPV